VTCSPNLGPRYWVRIWVQSRSDRKEGRVEAVEVFGGADRLCSKAIGGWHAGRGGLPEDGGDRAEHLPLEAQIRRYRGRRVAPAHGVGEGKHQAQATGGRPDPGQASSAGGDLKKVLKPAQKRLAVEFLSKGLLVSERRACHLVQIARSTHRYQSQAKDDTALRIRLKDLASSRVRYGYRRLHVLLLREGWQVNHKKVYRLYHEMNLSLRLKRSKKRPSLVRGLAPVARRPHERWSMDFVSDAFFDGRRFRALTINDNDSG